MARNKHCTSHSPLVTDVMIPDARSLEQKIAELMTAGSPIESIAPIIFTERKDGVIPAYDPRTDRFDIALDAASAIDATYAAQRQERIDAQNPTEEPKNE